MRLRMVHQLALLLLATVGLSVLCVVVGALLSLSGGASDYVHDRESRRLNRFAVYVGEQASDRGGLAAVASDFDGMRKLIDGFLAREGDPREPAPGAQGSRVRPPGFAGRIRILDTSGVRIAGSPAEPSGRTLRREILVNGRAVGTALLDLGGRTGESDIDFLQSQYQGVAVAAFVSLVVSMALAVRVARRWSRPLGALQEVTRKLAAGHFESAEPSFDGPQEIAQLSHDVSAMATSLRRLELTRRKWMAQISHELRTPLSVLQGEIESMEDGAREPNRALVMNLGEEVRHMVRIVDDLHLLAVADLGSLPCHKVDLDPLDTLEYVVAKLVRHPSLDGLEVEVTAAAPRMLRASWDPVRIEQVLRNLLTNSGRYTTRPGRVRVSWAPSEDGQHLRLTVEDSAPCVEPADIPHIFEPLFRGDRSRQRSGTGSGLGLAIVRAIVIAHGGTVDASPSTWGGLAMQVMLPVKAQQQGASA